MNLIILQVALMIYFEFKIDEYFLLCIYCDSNKSWHIKDLKLYLEKINHSLRSGKIPSKAVYFSHLYTNTRARLGW